MPYMGLPSLAADEIDDLLYLTRVNESTELKQLISELAQKYDCGDRDVVLACCDAESGNTMLHFCSANGISDLLSTLLTLLTEQASGDSAEKVEISMINNTNSQGNTPLHWAAYNGHLEVVKMLIKAGADMWIKNAAGHLAMFEAERAEKNKVVQCLLEAGGREVENTGRTGQADDDDEEEIVMRAGDVTEGDGSASNGVDVQMHEA